MMIGALHRLVRTTSPDSMLARARAGDAGFFARQYVPLAALASEHAGYPIVAFKQTNPVGDLDADHALLVLCVPLRAFITEVGTSVMTGQPMRFLVELDLAAATPTRAGNFGDVALPDAEFAAVAAALVARVFAVAGLEPNSSVSLRDELVGLLRLADTGVPTASTLRAYFAPRARAIAVAGPNLDWPNWASRAHNRDDVYVDLVGDVIGARLWDDERGYGASAELAVHNGQLADVERVTGPLVMSPPDPGSLDPTDASVAFVTPRGRPDYQLKVTVNHERDVVRQVTVQFPTPIDANTRR